MVTYWIKKPFSFCTDVQQYTRKLALGFVSCVCRFVGAFGNESYLDCPEGMAIGPNDTLYVASFLNDKVVKFSIPDGEFLGVVSIDCKKKVTVTFEKIKI